MYARFVQGGGLDESDRRAWPWLPVVTAKCKGFGKYRTINDVTSSAAFLLQPRAQARVAQVLQGHKLRVRSFHNIL